MCERCDGLRDDVQVISINVKWTVDDIKRVRPNWSVERCEHFIDSSYQEIAAEAREAGDKMIAEILEEIDKNGQEARN